MPKSRAPPQEGGLGGQSQPVGSAQLRAETGAPTPPGAMRLGVRGTTVLWRGRLCSLLGGVTSPGVFSGARSRDEKSEEPQSFWNDRGDPQVKTPPTER